MIIDVRSPTAPGGSHWFQILGMGGFLLGSIVAITTGRLVGVPVGRTLVLMVLSAIEFLLLSHLMRRLIGRPALIYLHHELALVVIAAVVSHVNGWPIMPMLDTTLIGLGICLAIGRIGCTLSGCCRGRVGEWGIRYSQCYSCNGLPRSEIGVVLLPVQVIEGAVALMISVTCVCIALAGSAWGSAAATHIGAYGVARVILEHYRGDSRATWARRSHTQWLILAIMLTAALLQSVEVLPGWPSHVLLLAACAALVVRFPAERHSSREISVVGRSTRFTQP